VRWPADFGRRFVVFVDVEEEFDWSQPLDKAQRAVTATAALPDAYRRFADAGVGLALMVDHPVAADPAAVARIRDILDDPRCSLGAQLHPWVTPPYAPPADGDSFAGNLPVALEAAKIDALTDLLVAAFGRQPLAFRAGRYGIGPATLGLLAARGYRIDTSMRSRYDYSGQGGPDFRTIGNHAFHRDGMIEMPLTTVFTGRLRRSGAWLHPVIAGSRPFAGALARARLLERIALTPEDMPIRAALDAVSIAVDEEDLRLLSLSFHSPSLAPGHTPYVRDAADLRRFWRWWDAMLAHLARLNVRPITLDTLSHAAA
jgi:hypothetical protein